MKLTFGSILAIVIGAQLGSGIFMLPKELGNYGIYSFIGWIISGTGALALVSVFAYLVEKIPYSGGPPIYIKKSLGMNWGFVTAWTYWIVAWFSTLPVLRTIALNVHSLTGIESILSIEIFFLTMFAILNCFSLNETARFEKVLSTMKSTLLIIVPILLIYFGSNHISEYQTIKMNAFDAIKAASVTTLWGFIGLELATTPASDVHKKSDIFMAMFLGVVIVLFIYLLNTYSIFYALPPSILQGTNTAYAAAMSQCFGSSWDKIISLILTIICMGTLNAWILATCQMSYGAAKEKIFHPIFKIKNSQNIPIYGLLIQYILLLICLIMMSHPSLENSLSSTIAIAALTYIFIFFISTIAYFKLLLHRNNIIAPILSLLFCLWMFFCVNKIELIISLSIPLSGYLFYKINTVIINMRK